MYVSCDIGVVGVLRVNVNIQQHVRVNMWVVTTAGHEVLWYVVFGGHSKTEIGREKAAQNHSCHLCTR